MKRVLVLMSTWNGADYIEDQLQSILNQSFDGRIDILIRDDGSQDATLKLLGKYLSDHVTLIRGVNIGAKASFFELIKIAGSSRADYYALADQDDIWLPDKISRAVYHLPEGRPALYCSALQLVDKRLHPMAMYQHPGDRTFISSLLSNYVTGCTCVFNKSLLDVVRFPVNASRVVMHDWWMACVASACGVVHYDMHSSILYRQHGANQVGIKTGISNILFRFGLLFAHSSMPTRLSQAEEFLCAYYDCEYFSGLRELNDFISGNKSPLSRLAYAVTHRSKFTLFSAARFICKG